MWDLGNNKKVCVRDFKGKTYIDIRSETLFVIFEYFHFLSPCREYYVDKSTMDTRPGKKGISLNTLQYQALKAIMDDIDHALP